MNSLTPERVDAMITEVQLEKERAQKLMNILDLFEQMLREYKAKEVTT
jgi:hypothetical protein